MVLHRVIDRVVFCGLLVTIVVTAIPYGSVQPWWVAVFECLVFGLGILSAVDLLITRERLPVGASVALPLVILCGFIFLQSLRLFAASNPVIPDLRLAISADPYTSQQVAIKLFALIVAGVLLLRHANSQFRLRIFVYVVIGVGVASALFGLIREAAPASTSWLFPLPDPARGFAQFVNRNHFGFLIEMTLGLTLGLVFARRTAFKKYLIFLPIAGFLWVTLIISNTRGGIFASLCQILFLGVLVDPLRRLRGRKPTGDERPVHRFAWGLVGRVVAALVLVAVFVIGASWIGGESVVSNFELSGYSFTQQGAQGHRENISRKDIWGATWQLIKAQPILGSGFGGYWIAITKYHNASGKFAPQEAHNDYLELLAGGGIIGTALVVWFGVRFVKSARNTLRADDPVLQAAGLGAVTGVFGVIIHSFVDFGLHVPANALIFAALVAIAAHGPRGSSDLKRSTGQLELRPQTDLATH